MKRIHLFLLTLTIGFLSSLSADPADPVERLLATSGLNEQVAQIPDAIKSGFLEGMHAGGGVPDDVALAIMESADNTLLPSVILNEIRTAYETTLSGHETAALLAWYESEDGRAITAAEEKASRPEAVQQMLDNARQLLADTARVEQAERFDKLLDATDRFLQMQTSIMAAAYASMATAMAPDRPLDLDRFKAQMDAESVRMRPGVHSYVITSFVYTYQSISDGMLERYERFLGQTVTQKFNEVTTDALNSGLRKIIVAWIGEVSVLLQKKRCEPPRAMGQTEI